MGTLKLTRGVKDPNISRVDKAGIIKRHISKYNRKLELMLRKDGSNAAYVYQCTQDYGMEWEDLSDKLKSALSQWAPKPKVEKKDEPKKEAPAKKASETKESSSNK